MKRSIFWPRKGSHLDVRCARWIRICLLAFLVLTPRPGLAAVLLVPESYATIQAALDATVPGDDVSVAPGTYVEDIAFVNDDVTLRSRVPHAATIQGAGNNNIVVFNTINGTIRDFVIDGAGVSRTGVFVSNAVVTIENNNITGNQFYGVSVSSGGEALIAKNRITNNGSIGLFAGILVQGGSVATIANNFVSGNAIGVRAWSGADGTVIVNNTIVSNPLHGLSLGESLMRVQNNVIVGSDYGIFFAGPPAPDRTAHAALFLSIDHNLLWDNAIADYYAELATIGLPFFNQGPFAPTPGTGEVLADPLLDAGTGYRLTIGSPAIDAGDSGALPAGITMDLDGGSRFEDDPSTPDTGIGTPVVDIGADEFDAPLQVPTMGVLARGFVLMALIALPSARSLRKRRLA